MTCKYLLSLLVIGLGIACHRLDSTLENTEKPEREKMQKTDYYIREYDPKTGIETLDFSLFKKKKTSPMVFSTREGGIITLYGPYDNGAEYDNGAYYEEYPAKKFYKIQRQFYLNGKLKQESSFYLGNLMINKTKYYAEEGNLIQELDEDKKFERSKIQIDDVLKLMHDKGWLNLETGEGCTEIREQSGHVIILQPKFSIQFIEEKGIPYWYASHMEDHDVTVGYKINGITGESEQFEEKIEEER